MKNNIKEYLEYYRACGEGLEWCMENCTSMHDVWMRLDRYDWMMWLISDARCLSDRECHEFGLWCVEQIQHLMTDDRSIAALKAKRDWLDGKITDEELQAARTVAWGAARGAAREARTVAWGAAREAARGAAREAREAREAAWEAAAATSRAARAAWGAARGAARGAVREAARSISEEAQLAWLRANTKPVFEIEDI